jgi:hypothetical protein
MIQVPDEKNLSVFVQYRKDLTTKKIFATTLIFEQKCKILRDENLEV